MKFEITSKVKVDGMIVQAMTPQEPAPFEQLLSQAQKTLDILAGSAYFRRYVEENLTSVRHTRVMRIARSSQESGAEWLVITDDYQLRFMRLIMSCDALIFYSYGEAQHDSFLLTKSRDRLEKMQTGFHAMQYLFSRFGQPSFNIGEIHAEMKRNGPLHLIEVTNLGNSLTTGHGDSFRHRMSDLQFEITSERRDLADTRPLPEDGQFIILLDIDPKDALEVQEFYDRLTPAQKRRIWTTKTGEGTYYRRFGFSVEILQYPGFIEVHELPNEELLEMISNMFTDPE